MKSTKQIFDFLPGIWKLARNIISKSSSINYSGNGYAAFSLSKKDLNLITYSEKITLSNLKLKTDVVVTQKYQYKYDPVIQSISKYFKDGKLFYTLNVREENIGGEHLCVLDTYKSSYVFDDDKLRITYSVFGPAKDYDIVSEYTKINTQYV